jgi:hypothetical protein
MREKIQKPEPEWLDEVMKCLADAEGLCRDVKLDGARRKIVHTNGHLKRNKERIDFSSLSTDLRNVGEMIASDFRHRKFIQIDSDFSSYVDNDNLFGPEVSAVFRSAVPDIREAGNCIAIDCGTAAVFHLMRAVECALRALCVHLGVTRIRRSNKPKDAKYVLIAWAQWGKMLNTCEARVKDRMDKLGPGKRKQEMQELYIPLVQDIRGFKDAFRNHVMHSRKYYSQQDAKAILGHVKRFMLSLAPRVSEC